jgi:hypothetical protein
MGQKYEQLSLEQRCTIARYSQAGKTILPVFTGMTIKAAHIFSANF